jgi:hypothetical protein
MKKGKKKKKKKEKKERRENVNSLLPFPLIVGLFRSNRVRVIGQRRNFLHHPGHEQYQLLGVTMRRGIGNSHSFCFLLLPSCFFNFFF